jgi:hypothetical protein
MAKDVTYCVSMILSEEETEHLSPPETFRTRDAAETFMRVAGRLGLGSVLFTASVVNGIVDVANLTEISRMFLNDLV